MKRFSIQRHIIVLGFLITSSYGSWAQSPTPAPHFLGDAFTDKGQAGLSVVRNEAFSQSTLTPRYKSNSVETRWYEGYFHPNTNNSKLALLSDDGSSIWIDDEAVLDRAGQGQGFEKFDSTFTPLNASFERGQSYHIRIKYTNTIHRDDADVDGLTLWAYDGGGEITVEEFPDFEGTGESSNDTDSQIQQSTTSPSAQSRVAAAKATIPVRQRVMLNHA